ncbi:hypothetical protein ACJW30_05G220000 [Castanea mollissima]
MRIQFAKENLSFSTVRQIKVQDTEELTKEAVTITLQRVINFYSTIQAHEGHWPGDYGDPMFLISGLERMKPTKWNFFHKSGEKEGDPIILCSKSGLIYVLWLNLKAHNFML